MLQGHKESLVLLGRLVPRVILGLWGRWVIKDFQAHLVNKVNKDNLDLRAKGDLQVSKDLPGMLETEEHKDLKDRKVV